MTCARIAAGLALAISLTVHSLPAQSQDSPDFQDPVRLPAVETSDGPTAELAMLPEIRKASSDNRDAFPLEELKKFAWRKGNVTITPYGTLWTSMAYETERSRITDYCLYIESPNVHGEPAASVDVKSTRLGFDVAGPTIGPCGDATTGGKVEIDFQAPFSTRNKGEIMLRHAYFEIKNADYRLLAGQTWDVVSPLGMPVINYPAGIAVGNIGYRRPQLRGERYLAYSDMNLLTLQGALATDVVYDFQGDSTINADQGPFPDIQARAAWTLGERRGADATPITIGVSGEIGEQDFDFRSVGATDIARRTWSLNGDFTVPLSTRFGFMGEIFTGENLSGYMGGVLQGVNVVTHGTIRATGGWGAIYYQATDKMRYHVGYGIDDPCDQDLTFGRTYNEVIFANCGYNWTKNLNTAVEVSQWKTGWTHLRPGEAFRIEFAAKYAF